jgi:AraC-like DNA-binding protein
MTQSEKNNIESENKEISRIQMGHNFLELGSIIYYMVAEGEQQLNFVSPIGGYLNVIVFESTSNCTYCVQDQLFIIGAGENLIRYLNESEIFELKSPNPNNIILFILYPKNYLINFHQKYMDQVDRFRNGLFTKSDNRIALTVKQVLELHQQDSFLNSLKIQSLFIELFIHQVEGIFAENHNKELIINKNHFDKIQLAKKIIDEDFAKNYTIAELARLVGTNEQYLKKYFKQQYGKTIMNYMTEMKMEHAKKLILLGKYRVSDVARMTGYKHSTHFTTAFKKYFGIIPNSLKYTFLVVQDSLEVLPEILKNIPF